ncbi:hypothetical protein HYV57_00490 [Candidatus Peregrinibacteria bacterium]|nr:hypothetical protein [Candidatus Peregrinibacteria bacterium]
MNKQRPSYVDFIRESEDPIVFPVRDDRSPSQILEARRLFADGGRLIPSPDIIDAFTKSIEERALQLGIKLSPFVSRHLGKMLAFFFMKEGVNKSDPHAVLELFVPAIKDFSGIPLTTAVIRFAFQSVLDTYRRECIPEEGVAAVGDAALLLNAFFSFPAQETPIFSKDLYSRWKDSQELKETQNDVRGRVGRNAYVVAAEIAFQKGRSDNVKLFEGLSSGFSDAERALHGTLMV